MFLSMNPDTSTIIATLSENTGLNNDTLRKKDELKRSILQSEQDHVFIIDTTKTDDPTISQIMTALSTVVEDEGHPRLLPNVSELIFTGKTHKIELVIQNIDQKSQENISTFATVEDAFSYLGSKR